jgi:hypothetical protein
MFARTANGDRALVRGGLLALRLDHFIHIGISGRIAGMPRSDANEFGT